MPYCRLCVVLLSLLLVCGCMQSEDYDSTSVVQSNAGDQKSEEGVSKGLINEGGVDSAVLLYERDLVSAGLSVYSIELYPRETLDNMLYSSVETGFYQLDSITGPEFSLYVYSFEGNNNVDKAYLQWYSSSKQGCVPEQGCFWEENSAGERSYLTDNSVSGPEMMFIKKGFLVRIEANRQVQINTLRSIGKLVEDKII